MRPASCRAPDALYILDSAAPTPTISALISQCLTHILPQILRSTVEARVWSAAGANSLSAIVFRNAMAFGPYVVAVNGENVRPNVTLTRPRDACSLSSSGFMSSKSQFGQSSPGQDAPVAATVPILNANQYDQSYFTPQLIDLPASVDWSPDMAIDSPALSFEMYEPSSSGPLRQGRSTQDWLFNTPIASFMARRREYGLQIDEESFLTSFALPPDHPSAVRPALRNAVYLLACHALSTRTPALAQYESLFVDKVRQGIANSLETAQEDSGGLFTGVILASILLARYLLIMGRIREAYHQTASVARFAISCGLHQLSTLDLRSHSPGSRAPLLLPPPTDFIALGERIHAFWAIYNLDRTISAVAGLPSTFGDDGSDGVDARERITTLWPRPLREYRSPEQLMHTPQSTISDYFSNVTLNGSVNRRVMNPGVHMLEAQAVEIHHRAHEAIHRSGADSGTSTRLFVLGRSALDLLRDAPPLDYFDDNDSEHTGVNPFIVKALALAYASQLKNIVSAARPCGLRRPGYAPNWSPTCRLLRRAQPTTGLDILVGVCCAFTLGFLKRASGADQVTEQLEKSLAYLRSAHVVLAIIPKRTRTSRIGIYHELGGLRPELGLLTVAPRVPLDYLGKRNPA
ncbi:GAL4-like Zn(II)2Cys6 (or C6 zinc) binuclear cluster DNA-binding domain [Rhizoctonia solani]|uniref:GAL4-like Zn(II)2Cys6 (Or C6 zinc) binuclear cluster DNA-binding domain n=1 Tax=Rhizoctonia solani TaxID=456999 RepID=A0A8H7I3M2_9AGAM|nr:GAL4-like Zn(II)2Cys6 (or C6 zinc) binuclear cluster DNA-binding domain [Rhizoctonia solani]